MDCKPIFLTLQFSIIETKKGANGAWDLHRAFQLSSIGIPKIKAWSQGIVGHNNLKLWILAQVLGVIIVHNGLLTGHS